MFNDILKTMGILYILQGTGEKNNFDAEADEWVERQRDYLDGVLHPGDRLNAPLYVNVFIENESYLLIEASFRHMEDALISTKIKSLSGLKLEVEESREFFEEYAEVVISDKVGLL